MLVRLSCAAALVAAGIASPWLAGDWLEWRAREEADRADAAIQVPGHPFASDGPAAAGNGAGPAAEEGRPSLWRSATAKLGEKLSSMTRVRGFPELSEALGDPFGKHPAGRPVTEADLAEAGERLAPFLEKAGAKLGDPVFLRLFKESAELEAWVKPEKATRFVLLRAWSMKVAGNREGPKARSGDGRAPEGFYYVSAKRMKPSARSGGGMDLGFPNAFDEGRGRGGSGSMIHGEGGKPEDFALGDGQLEEVYALASAALEGGQRFFRVHIFPFRMDDERMAEEWAREAEWIEFWANLKEGYDFFENVGVPPDVGVDSDRYSFRFPKGL